MINHRRHQTEYIQIDTHQCTGCNKCIEVCPKQVIGKIHFLTHRHAVIKHTEKCIGCMKCLKACTNQAITKREQYE